MAEPNPFQQASTTGCLSLRTLVRLGKLLSGLACASALGLASCASANVVPNATSFRFRAIQTDPARVESFPLLNATTPHVTAAQMDVELEEFTDAHAFWVGDRDWPSYVVEIGAQEAPASTPGTDSVPLVLVHGIGAAGMRDFYPILRGISKGRRVLLVELPGIGRSVAPPKQSLTPLYFAKRVAQVVQARIDGPFDLMGHSLGGNVCLTLAAHSELPLRRLIVVDAAGVLRPEALGTSHVTRAFSPLSRVDSGAEYLFQSLGRTLVEASSALEPSTHLMADGRWSGVDVNVATSLILHRMGPYLAGIRVPTLLLWGADDVVAPLRTARVLHDCIEPSVLTVLPSVGHVPMTQSPNEVIRAVVPFLNRPLRPVTKRMVPKGPAASPQEIDCEGTGARHLTGRFSTLRIIDCPSVVIEDASIKELTLEESAVKLNSVRVANGLAAFGSQLEITGGTYRGEVGVYLNESSADIAGARLRGIPCAVASTNDADLVLSATFIQSSHHRGFAHEFLQLEDGEAL